MIMPNREIKFRQYYEGDDDSNPEWNYFDLQNGKMVVDGGWKDPQQFTGLLDKKGVEIFEGDIFRDNEDGECDYVFFRLGGFATKTWWSPQELAENAPHWEVIGNIMENPELLK